MTVDLTTALLFLGCAKLYMGDSRVARRIEVHIPFEEEGKGQLKQVPVDDIFRVESRVHNRSAAEEKSDREAYERYAGAMMSRVKAALGVGDVADVPEEKLSKAVVESYAKYRNAYEAKKLFTTSFPDEKDNQFPAAVLMADVLTRFGKKMDVAVPEGPERIVIAGEKCGITTIRMRTGPEHVVYLKEHLESTYKEKAAGDVGLLLEIAKPYGLKESGKEGVRTPEDADVASTA